jgi:hypothetical protein
MKKDFLDYWSVRTFLILIVSLFLWALFFMLFGFCRATLFVPKSTLTPRRITRTGLPLYILQLVSSIARLLLVCIRTLQHSTPLIARTWHFKKCGTKIIPKPAEAALIITISPLLAAAGMAMADD